MPDLANPIDAAMPVGVAFTPFETRTDVIVRIASLADELGVARLDVAEGWTLDATVVLAELAARTSRIGLGTSVLSVWGRTPATIALAAAGLQRASRGRFTLGLGAGSPPLTEGFHGTAWSEPFARVRETLIAVRALLAGERLPNPVAGARPLRLGAPPPLAVPIALAALSPPSIRLAGELADEWTPFLWARSRVSEGRELLAEGESRAGEAAQPTEADQRGRTRVAVGVPVAIGADEASARRLAAWWLATYATRMGPLYPRLLGERFGMADGLTAVVAAAGQGGETELPAAAEELAREVTLLATHASACAEIAAWFAAGADSVQLVLPPGRPPEELAEVVRVAAAAGRALSPA
jgi:alkanesulfonate monooxygenase SsuD/methylene tetrahydromethanopterin reductase-like flavin-dependent oxidoreductase (luciferase family)